MTSFGQFVSGYGVPSLIRDLRTVGEPIHPNTVYRWLAGRAYVRPSIALKLVDLGRGQISLDDVYGHRRALQALAGDETKPE